MMSNITKTAFITGASTGIGYATAKQLLDNGYRVFGSVRKKSDVADLVTEFPDRFTRIIMDVTDQNAITAAAVKIKKDLGDDCLGILINNAGIAVSGPLAHIPIEDVQFQFDVNVKGLLMVTQAILPLMGLDKSMARQRRLIINIGSVAGRLVAPFFGPYAISKHAVEAITDSLRRELLMYGIDAVNVAPGAIKTPIWEKADGTDITPYEGTDYYDPIRKSLAGAETTGSKGIPVENLARKIHSIIEDNNPKPRYAILNNKFMMWTLPQWLGKRRVDKILAKQFGLV